ncbi:DinB family protein [Flavobacteriales bacterium]|nr:DinB family protein [Flavobacteriales bacterium]
MNTDELLDDLIGMLEESKLRVEQLPERSLEDLNWRPSEDKWTVLECLEHLNLYGDFYIPEIERVIKKSRSQSAPKAFKQTWWGDFFVNALAPKSKQTIKPLSAMEKLNPKGMNLGLETVERFITQHSQLINLYKQARLVDIQHKCTGTTIPLVRLRLVDSLRGQSYHSQRHIDQAFGVLEQFPQS